jgi:twitching motility protein PilU
MEEALKNADSENNLRLRIKLVETEGEPAIEESSGLAGLTLEKTHEERAQEARIAQEEAELAELMGA